MHDGLYYPTWTQPYAPEAHLGLNVPPVAWQDEDCLGITSTLRVTEHFAVFMVQVVVTGLLPGQFDLTNEIVDAEIENIFRWF